MEKHKQDQRKQRYELAKKLRGEGKKFREIGEVLGVGAQRARQIVEEYDRVMRRLSPSWTDGLNTMTANALKCAEFTSKEHLENVISDKGLAAGDYPRIGVKGVSEILKFLCIKPYKTKKDPTEMAIQRAIALLELNGYSVVKLPNA